MADPIWGAWDRELKIRNWKLEKFVKQIAILIGLCSHSEGTHHLPVGQGSAFVKKSDAEVYVI